MSSFWSGDDWPNSQVPHWSRWRYGDVSIERVWNTIKVAHANWATGQGRFFPVNIFEANMVFFYLDTLTTFKLYQFVILLAAVASFVWLVWLLSKNHLVVIGVILALSLTLQFRRDFDPHLAFSGVVPSALLKLFLASGVLYLATQQIRLFKHLVGSLLGGLLYFAAMSTYELAVFLVFVPLISVWIGVRRSQRSNPLLAPLLVALTALLFYLWIVFVLLRPNANIDTGSAWGDSRYVLSLSRRSAWIFVSQFLAAVPLVTLDVSKDLLNSTAVNFGVAIGVIFAVSAWKHAKHVTDQTPRVLLYPQRKLHVGLVSLGILLMAVPGASMSIRSESYEASRFRFIEPNLTYLHILASEFGAALCLASAFVIFVSCADQEAAVRRCKAVIITFSFVLALTVSHNHTVSAETKFRRLNYESWSALIADRVLFNEMRDGDAIISTTHNDAYETNAANFYSKSGIRLKNFFPLVYMYSEEELFCSRNRRCVLSGPQERIPAQLVNLGYDKSDPSDWVWYSLQPEQLASMRVYAFDIYPVTPSTLISFVAPMDNSTGLEVRTVDLIFARVTRVIDGRLVETIRPSLGGVCLEPYLESRRISPNGYPLEISYWKFPPGEPNSIEYQSLSFGVC